MKNKLTKIQNILKKAKTLGSHFANNIIIKDNVAMMTDGSRLVLINNVNLEDEQIGEGKIPTYTENLDNALIMWEGEIDMASFCSDHDLMNNHNIIMFKAEYVHYLKGIECVANVENAKIAAMSSEFFADVVRFHRILSGKREKSCKFNVKIVKIHNDMRRFIIEKGDMKIIIASNDPTCYYEDSVVIDYQLETRKIF